MNATKINIVMANIFQLILYMQLSFYRFISYGTRKIN